jgi:heme/copper-type cytochrome/quinol oxidase subunit 4
MEGDHMQTRNDDTLVMIIEVMVVVVVVVVVAEGEIWEEERNAVVIKDVTIIGQDRRRLLVDVPWRGIIQITIVVVMVVAVIEGTNVKNLEYVLDKQ